MSGDDDDHDDSDMLGVVELVAKVFEHTLRMAGRHGVVVDDAQIERTVKAILEKEDCWTYESDLSQAIITMLELPLALGAYNEPLDLVLSNEVVSQIDLKRSNAQAADRRANVHVLRRPTPDKPKR
ncbi:hypothetical protein [Reyranella soli]|uniref:Uncharacterized protein n=1 Tax=Reyranella soli TaxID=1230389 RepID=A0A512N8M5_9HYPH|nr:hypothetical protein [Reyranella soli]GEP55350.1 hypothetical protein RSO01_25160 [Reyranella soli]